MSEHTSAQDAEDARRERYESAVSRDWRFRGFFEALQFSPSYRLAHRVAACGLGRHTQCYPRDFPSVKKTYGHCENVYDCSFREWWIEHGQYLFGVAIEPEFHVFMKLEMDEEPTDDEVKEMLDDIDQHLLFVRPSNALPAALVMVVELNPDRAAMLQAFNKLLNEVQGVAIEPRKVSMYRVLKNKIRQSTVDKAFRVAKVKATYPDEPLWQIGNRAGVSMLHATDASAPPSDPEIKDKRRVMAILTSRELNRAYTLAEHAARGVFPSLEKLPDDPGRPAFDYAGLAHR